MPETCVICKQEIIGGAWTLKSQHFHDIAREKNSYAEPWVCSNCRDSGDHLDEIYYRFENHERELKNFTEITNREIEIEIDIKNEQSIDNLAEVLKQKLKEHLITSLLIKIRKGYKITLEPL
jgi:hypothetical protein